MKRLLLSFMSVLVCATSVQADEAAVAKGLAKVIPEVTAKDVFKTPISGLYQVNAGARVFYASDDGRYIIQGELVDLVKRENLTANALKYARKTTLAKVDEKSMIIFPAKNAKHTVTIFSDIDCGYCRKLHAELSDYTDAGITVRYLFFPRSGVNTESYFKAVSVWCAADRNKALTDAKLNNKIDSKTCDNPIDAHMKLAKEFGVNGTPAIIADDGTMIPGFVPAAQLVEHMAW